MNEARSVAISPSRSRGAVWSRLRARADSLGGRMIAASSVLAILVAGVFAVLVFAVRDLRDATAQESRSKDVITSTLALEKLVLDLETGARGFAITGRPRLLDPWSNARAALPERIARFERLIAGDPTIKPQGRQLVALVEEYEEDYSVPLVSIARENPAAARTPLATAEGQRRTDQLRDRFTEFLARENARALANTASARTTASRALKLGVGGLVICALLALLFGAFLARSIARPVREVAEGATRLAGGDLATRLAASGPGEVGELRVAFNAMAESLEESRQELESQNELLRESDRLKSELVSIVSHELRTPLATIMGFTDVLLTRSLDLETQQRYLGIIDTQAKRLSDLVRDFLDVKRIQEGGLELKRELIDMAALLREQAQLLFVETERHELTLDLADERLPVYGDQARLTQVVSNLLSNAIKYSPDGGQVALSGEGDEGTVRIWVRDEGVGIPHDQQTRIFTKFFRGDANARGIPGTGLGLALAREIVEAHGGRIGFTSAANQGSTFWFELPAADRVPS